MDISLVITLDSSQPQRADAQSMLNLAIRAYHLVAQRKFITNNPRFNAFHASPNCVCFTVFVLHNCQAMFHAGKAASLTNCLAIHTIHLSMKFFHVEGLTRLDRNRDIHMSMPAMPTIDHIPGAHPADNPIPVRPLLLRFLLLLEKRSVGSAQYLNPLLQCRVGVMRDSQHA